MDWLILSICKEREQFIPNRRVSTCVTVGLQEGKDDGLVQQSADLSLQAMVSGAQALIKAQNIDIADDPEAIIAEYQERLNVTHLIVTRLRIGGVEPEAVRSSLEAIPALVSNLRRTGS